MSTTVAATTTANATVTSSGGATASTPSYSPVTTSSTSTPVPSTAISSKPSVTPCSGAAPPGIPFATSFNPGGGPLVVPSPSCLRPESFTVSGDFEDYLQQFNPAVLLSGWSPPTHDNQPQNIALCLRGTFLPLLHWRLQFRGKFWKPLVQMHLLCLCMEVRMFLQMLPWAIWELCNAPSSWSTPHLISGWWSVASSGLLRLCFVAFTRCNWRNF